MDENFLLHRERASELLRRMKKAGKSWGDGGVRLGQRERRNAGEVENEFGLRARAASRLGGPFLLWTSRRQDRRLAAAHL